MPTGVNRATIWQHGIIGSKAARFRAVDRLNVIMVCGGDLRQVAIGLFEDEMTGGVPTV